MNKSTCTVEGCDNLKRARGLCSTHYNQLHQPDRHRPRLVPCVMCGKEVLRAGGGGRKAGAVCSDQCRAWLRYGYCVLPLDHWARWYGRTSPWSAPVAPPDLSPRACLWCGVLFTPSRVTQVLCSVACKSRAKRARRRARKYAATGTYTWTEVTHVWLHIGKVCAYCHEPTTQIEPDHVIPLARGGSNSITNILPSCQRCNGDKRELLIHEWAADRVRRGLKPLSIHPKITHLTHVLVA